MAPTVHETVLIDADLTGNLPTNGYRVLFDGLERVYEPMMAFERSLTGAMHVHRILESGSAKVPVAFRYRLFLTRAEKDLIAADLGRVVYFMPHYRDEGAGYAPYRHVMLLSSMSEVRNVNPMLDYYTAIISLEEADGQTP